MTNAFTLNSAEQSPTTRRAEQLARGAQRRHNIAPIRMTYDTVTAEKCETPEKHLDDFSFYEGNSPQQSPPPCPIDACMQSDLSPETSPLRYAVATEAPTVVARRIPSSIIEDPNTCDSGFSQDSAPSSSSVTTVFKFPSGLAPRKTPAKSPTNRLLFHSMTSSNSMESGMDDMELFDMDDDEDDDDQTIPDGFSSLLSGSIKAVRNSPVVVTKRMTTARRSLSLTEPTVRRTLTATPERRRPMHVLNTDTTITTTPKATFKRPEPPTISPTQSKRLKYENTAQENVIPSTSESAPEAAIVKPVRPLFKKSISMNDTQTIMTALHRCK